MLCDRRAGCVTGPVVGTETAEPLRQCRGAVRRCGVTARPRLAREGAATAGQAVDIVLHMLSPVSPRVRERGPWIGPALAMIFGRRGVNG
jgi:hypothetical protein